jgi:type IV secretion system protein VirB10
MIATAAAVDPRLALAQEAAEASQDEQDIRPLVTPPRRGLSNRTILVVSIIVGIGLFAWLDSARRDRLSGEGAVTRSATASAFAPPPALVVPLPEPVAMPPATIAIEPAPAAPPPPPYVAPSYVQPPQPYYPPPSQPQMPASPDRQSARSNEPAMVIDLTSGPASGGPGASAPGTDGGADTPIRATIIRNRGALVPQGSLIAAVLETPIDSTRPGLVRAVVSRDARGFDGTRILIPRGSRLIGEFQALGSASERRVLVTWTRLIRPDGVAIRIASPGADTLGAAGVTGKVATNFVGRFANAVLQSALTVGVNLASQAGDRTVILGLPGQIGTAGQALLPPVEPRTKIRVRQGTEISIFVARDLDFGGLAPQR